ncbi:helix-turn-helix transcriptional regulator [Gilvimarinus xylanilyticus]|uniref:Helix-turn-helix domain-containing protein n=1 Tax=Gilvimarinus xylanilyticus TaxID=2944139 RepID=A0A9X2HV01_9GAMM|nr:helix-turn-helix transcriptional regulator [Gilvimarinus xylanilyticus]MCP8898705.1 helix-turn-helix domain-containing protein [Gilvimarinus xylanilyticus]
MRQNYAKTTAADLGERLKQARLNLDLTQVETAERAGVTRKAVLNAEKGQATLEVFVAIMHALDQAAQLDNFLPPPPISPVQLAKLQGKKRKRASGSRKEDEQEPSTW